MADDQYFIETNKPDFNNRQSLLEQIRDAKFQQQKNEKLRLQAIKEERKRTENQIKKRKTQSRQRGIRRKTP